MTAYPPETVRERVADMISFAEAVQSGYSKGPDQAVAALVAETYRQAADEIEVQTCQCGCRRAAAFLRHRADEIEKGQQP